MEPHQITYKNRRGTLYFLCRKLTKKGKSRYVFTKSPSGEKVCTIPDGYEIRESVNGIVSLGKLQNIHLLKEEIQVLEDAISRKPDSEQYRLVIKPNFIEVHQASFEREEVFGGLFPLADPKKIQEVYLSAVSYSPVMKFNLVDKTTRMFRAQRMGYRASLDGWLWLDPRDSIENLSKRLIPLLGTNKLFEIDIDFGH